MATHVIFHEVDDVEHWLQSPKREEVFGPIGITVRTFRDPQGSNRVGLIVEIPDMGEFQEFMQTEAAAEAMRHDGVRPDTLLVLEESQAMTVDIPAAPASALADVLDRFFATKTDCDVEGTMSYFAPDMASYIDATLGWDLGSHETLKGVFAEYMPNWGTPARSYATKILSGETSALVYMVDTPELFGGELRILSAIDFADGKIVRWVDYWDSSAFDADLYAQFRTPADRFPTDLKDGQVPTRAAPELVDPATALQQAFGSADAAAAHDMLHTDVVLVDMALRAQVIGRIETVAYLDRVLDQAPYGRSSELRHVVGGAAGGGFEWTAADALVGITALERDADGLITSITSVYDSRQLEPARKAGLIAASFAP